VKNPNKTRTAIAISAIVIVIIAVLLWLPGRPVKSGAAVTEIISVSYHREDQTAYLDLDKVLSAVKLIESSRFSTKPKSVPLSGITWEIEARAGETPVFITLGSEAYSIQNTKSKSITNHELVMAELDNAWLR
jgi:hypothetical protein